LPTTDINDLVQLGPMSEPGEFITTLSGLSPSTTYFVRAYVQTNTETVYANEKSFSTQASAIDYGTVTDVAGNEYRTIHIGTQTWMADNLKTGTLNDGTTLPDVTDGGEWGGLTAPAYCWYSNVEQNYGDPFGALYNYYAVETGKLCPAGWHVPAAEEWDTLISFVGGEEVAGGMLKEGGIAHWTEPNTGATNESGFSAVGGGARNLGGNFHSLMNGGFYWTSSDTSLPDAHPGGISINFWYTSSSITVSVGQLTNCSAEIGYSVRCIKDGGIPE
jgi:uncharacterized protein (TIGR02145 family)